MPHHSEGLRRLAGGLIDVEHENGRMRLRGHILHPFSRGKQGYVCRIIAHLAEFRPTQVPQPAVPHWYRQHDGKPGGFGVVGQSDLEHIW